MTLSSVGQTMKDFYPLPGERLKQYVVDTNREYAWEEATCPVVDVPTHHHSSDGEGSFEFDGELRWTLLARMDCDFCENLYYSLRDTPAVKAWLAEKAKRPPVEPDRTKLSDQIAPEWPAMREHPMFALTKKPNQETR